MNKSRNCTQNFAHHYSIKIPNNRQQYDISNMKLMILNGSMLIAGLSAIGLASISLEPVPLQLYAGDVHELSWTTDQDYVSNFGACESRSIFLT